MSSQTTLTIKAPLAHILVCLLIVISPLMVGSVHPLPILVLSVLSLLAAWRSMSGQPQLRVSLMGTGFLGLGLIALLQTLPMPASWLQTLSPNTHQFHLLAAQTLDPSVQTLSGWFPLSLDPRRTFLSVLRWSTLAALLQTCANLPRNLKIQRFLMRATAGSLALMLGVGLLQKGIDPVKILGFFTAQVPSKMGSTFVSWNHASSLYLFGAVVIAYSAIAAKHIQAAERIAMLLVSLTCVIASQFYEGTGSLMILGFSLFWFGGIAGLKFRAAAPTQHRVLHLLTIPVLFSLVLSVLFWGVASTSSETMITGSSFALRGHLISHSISSSLHFPLFGSGAGSVADALPPFLDWNLLPFQGSIGSVEHTFAEWIFTMGPLFGGVATLGFLFLLFLPGLAAGCQREPSFRAATSTGIGLLIFMIAQSHFPFLALGLAIPMLVWWEFALQRTLRGVTPLTSKGPRVFSNAVLLAQARLPYTRIYPLVGVLALATLLGALGTFMLQTSTPRQTLEHRPAHAKAWLEVGQAAHKAEDLPLAERAYRRAYTLQNRSTHVRALARILSLQGKFKEASALHQPLLHGANSKSAMVFFLRDVPSGPVRHKVLQGLPPKQWQQAILMMLKYEGYIPATQFVEALVDARSKDLHALETLLALYDRLAMNELIEVWLLWAQFETFSTSSLSKSEVIAFYTAKLQRRTKQPELAHETLLLHAPESARIANMLLQDPLVLKEITSPKILETLTQTHTNLCKTTAKLGSNCLHLDAILLEANGNLKRSEALWKRLSNRQKNPLILAKFFLRHGKCISLETLVQRAPKSKRSTLNAMADSCHKSKFQ